MFVHGGIRLHGNRFRLNRIACDIQDRLERAVARRGIANRERQIDTGTGGLQRGIRNSAAKRRILGTAGNGNDKETAVLQIGKSDFPLRQHTFLQIGQQIDLPIDSLRAFQQFDRPADRKSQISRAPGDFCFPKGVDYFSFVAGRLNPLISRQKDDSGRILLVQRIHQTLRLSHGNLKSRSAAGH